MENYSGVKVSVVVPTYNVEPYFRECLDSLAAQTLNGIEFIIINDGSPDNCGAIADEYVARDGRFRVIHKANGGYGSAVNLGFAEAKGEYVGIVEPDDWIEPEMYEKLYTQAKRLDADVCKCGFYVYNSKSKYAINREWFNVVCRISDFPIDCTFKVSECVDIITFHPSIWTNIYRKQFLNENVIKIVETQGASYQDLPFMVEVMCRSERIAVINQNMYHWRFELDQQSSTSTKGAKLMILAEQCIKSIQIAKDNHMFEILKEALGYQIIKSCYAFYMQIKREYRGEFRKMLKDVFLPFYEDPTYSYTYLSKMEISFFKDFILNDKDICTWSLRVLRRKLLQLHLNKNSVKLSLFGVVLYDNRSNE